MKKVAMLICCFALLIAPTVASATAIPDNSILVATEIGVVAFDLNGNHVGGITPQSGETNITDVLGLPNGDILLADAGVGQVTRYGADGVYISTVSGVTAGRAAHDLTLSPDGTKAYVSNLDPAESDIHRIDLATNTVDVSINYQTAKYGRGMDFGSDGLLYHALNAGGVYKMAAALDTAPELVGTTTVSRQGGTFGPDGRFYTCTYSSRQVQAMDVSTGVEVYFIGSGGNGYTSGILFHPTTGNPLVGNIGVTPAVYAGNLTEFDATTGAYIGVFANTITSAGAGNVPWGMSYYAPEPATLLGDANQDGLVSADDYASVQANYGNTGSAGGGLMGDANHDGLVSADDYASIQANFGNTSGAMSAVPEPATMVVLAIGGVMALLRRRLA